MSVPNDVVGAVIGKRGAKINEIRQIRSAPELPPSVAFTASAAALARNTSPTPAPAPDFTPYSAPEIAPLPRCSLSLNERLY